MTDEIRILLVDDHTVMRAGTRRILEDEPDLRVVGEADDGVAAVALVTRVEADLMVLDIGMPNMNGVRVCQAVRKMAPEMRILILTGHDNEGYVRALHALGVRGYLLKSAAPADLVSAIRRVMGGERVYCTDASQVIARADEPLEPPTQKELAVLHALAHGKRNREIAEALHLSINTVE